MGKNGKLHLLPLGVDRTVSRAVSHKTSIFHDKCAATYAFPMYNEEGLVLEVGWG